MSGAWVVLLVAAVCILLPGALIVLAIAASLRSMNRAADAERETRQGQTPGSQLDSPPPAPPWPLA